MLRCFLRQTIISELWYKKKRPVPQKPKFLDSKLVITWQIPIDAINFSPLHKNHQLQLICHLFSFSSSITALKKPHLFGSAICFPPSHLHLFSFFYAQLKFLQLHFAASSNSRKWNTTQRIISFTEYTKAAFSLLTMVKKEKTIRMEGRKKFTRRCGVWEMAADAAWLQKFNNLCFFQ